MKTDWMSLILDSESPTAAWKKIYDALLFCARSKSSPVELHHSLVLPDRLLSEAAWDMWLSYPSYDDRTSKALSKWCTEQSSTGFAVLILDALSLRELPLILGGAETRHVPIIATRITASECPTTTDQFAKALGLPSRSALADNNPPATFSMAREKAYTDVVSIPFGDFSVPTSRHVFLWHTWLDDLIHLHKKLPDQVQSIAASVFRGNEFWDFINKLRTGRKLVITSDHGYAVSKLFSSEVVDPSAVAILRDVFGASRCKTAGGPWDKKFMPPLVMTHNGNHVVMGQWKWKVQGGFPHICHGGLSLLEVAVPFIEIAPL